MKKIEKVSIADISFTLDNDAYVSLKQYLDSLHGFYDNDPDGSEIITDIEARIAELILNEQVYTKVVSKRLIDSIISQLGTPEEIDDHATEAGAPTSAPQEPSIPRRLYRSREGRILGGVCSGMSQFWDVNVAWLRLGFLLPFIIFIITAPFHWEWIRDFSLGWTWVFIVTYIVLWMALPIAKTPRQKLESRGERITPSSIRQNLQEGAKTPSSKKAASVFAEILAVCGRVLLFFVKFIVAVIGFSLVISALVILVAMIALPFAPMAPSVSILGWDVMSIAGLSLITPILFAELALLCVMIPMFVIGMALLSLSFNWKLGRIFYAVTLGLWLVIMVFITIVAASNARYLRDEIRTRRGVVEWFDGKAGNYESGSILKEFLQREDDGKNTITINISRDSIEVVSWRDHTADSTYVSDDGVLKYRSRIVIRDEKGMKEALREIEKREPAEYN